MLKQKLQPISDKEIEPVLVICPQSMQCEKDSCNGQSLRQDKHE